MTVRPDQHCEISRDYFPVDGGFFEFRTLDYSLNNTISFGLLAEGDAVWDEAPSAEHRGGAKGIGSKAGVDLVDGRG